MNFRHLKYYRVSFGIVAVCILVFSIALLAQIWAYFNKGADRSTALNLQQLNNNSFIQEVSWLPSFSFHGRVPGEYNRAEIIRAYLGSWMQQEISYLTGDTNRLVDYYNPELLPEITNKVKALKDQHVLLQQVDLDHHISMNFFSADGQIAAFSDEQVLILQRGYDQSNNKMIISHKETKSFKVVMLLVDDRWKIKAIEQKDPVNIIEEDTIRSDREGLIQVKGTDFILNGQVFLPHGINYYPQKSPWTDFWPSFDSSVIEKDLVRIRNLGFNVIRIFVNYADFNSGNVNPLRISQLKKILDLAEHYQLKVIVTLFDFLGDYSLMNYPAMEQQIKMILTVFRYHKAIMAWDLKNEPDLDFANWPKENIIDWLDWVLTIAKKSDPNHLITIGWAHPEAAENLSDKTDFVSFHSYRSPALLDADLHTLRKKIPAKPLVLEEYGMPTYKGIWAPMGADEARQANYFGEVKKVLHRHNISSLVWTLYDFTQAPETVAGKLPWHRKPQLHFGILRVNGSPKPGVDSLRR